MLDILETVNEWLKNGQKVALATVVSATLALKLAYLLAAVCPVEGINASAAVLSEDRVLFNEPSEDIRD